MPTRSYHTVTRKAAVVQHYCYTNEHIFMHCTHGLQVLTDYVADDSVCDFVVTYFADVADYQVGSDYQVDIHIIVAINGVNNIIYIDMNSKRIIITD